MNKSENINNLFSVQKLNIIITGASRGIGVYLGNFLYNSGSNLLLLGRSKRIKNKKLFNQYKSCDINNILQFKKICTEFKNKFGKIDVLINNAGISLEEKSEKKKIENFVKTIETNLISTYKCCETIYPLMKNGGSIINISSIGSLLAMKKNPGYVASKGGINSMTRSLAEDYSKKKIRVNAILPGYVKTKMTEKSYKNFKKKLEREEKTILNRWAEPKDLVGIIIFLATKSSSFVTGANIIVDGGFSIKGI